MMETNASIQKVEKKPRKIRSPFDKEGSFKYLQRWMRRVEDKIDDLGRTQAKMMKGLDQAGQLIYDRTYLEEVLHLSEVDGAIISELYDAGEEGRLPRDVAAALNKEYKTKHYQPWHVRFAIYRMNQKLTQINECLAMKRGMRWALTPFARKAWKLTKEELEKEEAE